MTAEIQNFTRDVSSRIKWKKARPLIQYELDELMESIYNDYIDSGMEHTQAIAKTIEDTGDPSELALEYNAEYRPNRPWEIIFMLAAIFVSSILFTGGVSSTPVQVFLQNIQLVIVVIGATLIGYMLDTDLIERYITLFYSFYFLLLFVSVIIPMERGSTLAPFLFMMNPVLFSAHVCASVKYGRRGVYMSIATLYPTTILSLFSQAQGQQFLSVVICLIIGLIAIWKNYYPKDDRRLWYVSGGLFAVLIAMLLLSAFLTPTELPGITTADFMRFAAESKFIGRSHLAVPGYEFGPVHTVIQSILYVGVFGAVILLAIYAIFFWSSFAALRRIKSGAGQFFALSIILVLLFSLVAFFLSNLGLLPHVSLPVPFYGDKPAVVISGLLVGLLLSVIRNGPVLFDNLPLISK